MAWRRLSVELDVSFTDMLTLCYVEQGPDGLETFVSV